MVHILSQPPKENMCHIVSWEWTLDWRSLTVFTEAGPMPLQSPRKLWSSIVGICSGLQYDNHVNSRCVSHNVTQIILQCTTAMTRRENKALSWNIESGLQFVVYKYMECCFGVGWIVLFCSCCCCCCWSFPSLATLCEAYEKWAQDRSEAGRQVKAISVGYIAFSEGHSIKTTYGNSFLCVAGGLMLQTGGSKFNGWCTRDHGADV